MVYGPRNTLGTDFKDSRYPCFTSDIWGVSRSTFKFWPARKNDSRSSSNVTTPNQRQMLLPLCKNSPSRARTHPKKFPCRMCFARRGVFSDRLDPGRQDEFNVEQLFPSNPRFSHLFFTTLGPDDGSFGDDENALSTAVFNEVWQVAEQVKSYGRVRRFSSK